MADLSFDDLIPAGAEPAPPSFDDLIPAQADKKKFGIGDTWPAKIVKGIYSAATLPGDVLAGNAKLPSMDASVPGSVPYGDAESAGDRVADLTMLGTPAGLATRHGAGVYAVPRTPRPAQETADLTQRQIIAEASERQGVPIPRAAASESIPVQASAGALKEIPGVGTPLVKSSQNSLREMDRAVGETVAGYGSGQPLAAGDAVITGIENWIGGQSGKVAQRLYSEVDSKISPTYTRELHATQKVLADIMARRANARIAGKSPAVDEVLEATQAPGGLNYQGIKDLRSHIGEMTPQEMVAKGIKATEAKRIYNAMTQDLRGTVLDAGGPDALKSFDRANKLYEAIAAKREALSKVIGVKGDATPERVMARITEMASSKGGADYQGLAQIRRAIGPANWDEVTSAFVNKMGRDKPGGEFSGDRFRTSWNAIPDNTKRLMFNSTGKTGLAKSVEDIVTLSEAHRQLMKYGNPSGTGRTVTFTGLLGALWAEPMTALATATGGNIMARVLASPIVAKQAANWSNAYVNAAKSGSPGHISLLTSASANLANTLNKQFGTALSGPDLLRLQGSSAVKADDQRPPYADGGEVEERDPFDVAAERTRRAVMPMRGRDEGGATAFLSNAVPETLKHLAHIPERAFQASADFRETGHYNPAPFVETAVNMIGFGGPAAMTSAAGAAGGKLTQPGIKAYHGSPHDFDRFDMRKIGTGEGHQAYGHGLYFAENPAVAKEYRDNLARRFSPASLTDDMGNLTINGAPLRKRFDVDNMPEFSQLASAGDHTGLRELVSHRLSRWRDLIADKSYPFHSYAKDKVAAYEGLASELAAGSKIGHMQPPQGRMYEVNINAKPEQFLDWDKHLPLAHPAREVASDAIKKPGWFTPEPERTLRPISKEVLSRDPAVSGSELYGMLSRGLSNRGNYKDDVASAVLRDAGVPGIKYWDQGSRTGGGAGTSNYVVFDDKIIDILRKYGIAGLAMLPPATQAAMLNALKSDQAGEEPTE